MDKDKRNSASGKIRKNEIKLYLVPCVDFLIASWISYVMLRSPIGLVFFFPIVYFHMKYAKKRQAEEKLSEFEQRYRELLSSLSGSLRAGHSLENAFRDAENNMVLLYEKDDFFVKELSMMNRSIDMRVPVEKVFADFAKRHPYEEVVMMSDIIGFAKRMGGNYIENISRTLEKINDSLALKEEIKAMTSEKRLELKLMLIMPPGIITYIALSSPEFMQSIYGNALGFFIVISCMVLYVLAIILGERIIRIEV